MKSLSGYLLLMVFCLRFLPSLEMHDHRTSHERCIQEHLEHRNQYSSCELTEVLGWDFGGHCSDKNHLKETQKECASCGFDFIKNFDAAVFSVQEVSTFHLANIDFPIENCYSGFTLLLCNKGPPAFA